VSTQNNLVFTKGEAPVEAFVPVGPVNIAGWTLSVSVRRSLSDNAPLFVLTQALGTYGQVTISNATLGQIAVLLTSAATQLLGTGMWYYELDRIDMGAETSLAWGYLIILPGARLGA
jgi:hypothetical protein